MPKSQVHGSNGARRDFLKTTALAGATMAGLSIARGAHAAGSDLLKIGLIGCGGRGTGAAANALEADPNSKLVAMADAFDDRLQGSLNLLKKQMPDRVDVTPERMFKGLDGYKQVIASGVDVVLLCEPPHFRPIHLKEAIAAGKHVFCEKPVAVDGPGVRSILETTEEARKKNLSLVSGLCWRYDAAVCATMQQILDGAIGDLVSMQVTYNTGMLTGANRSKKPDETEMEYQMRNWYCFTWLSGDHNVEQHIHSLDKVGWAMKDEPPAAAWGLGGRQVRTDAKYGDIYDHHAVCYEYANGVRAYSFCRQQPGCWNDTTDNFFGTKGRANVLNGFTITDNDGKVVWKWDPKSKRTNMYVAEHQALFAAIRAGKPINNGVYMARSTLLAILGRMVNYTGKRITWEQAMNSQQSLAPSAYTFDAEPPTKPGPDGRYPVATPGLTQFT